MPFVSFLIVTAVWYIGFAIRSIEDFNQIERQLQELRLDPAQLEQEAHADIIETLTFYNDTIDRLEYARLRVAEENKKIEGLNINTLERKIGELKMQKQALETYLAKSWRLPEPV